MRIKKDLPFTFSYSVSYARYVTQAHYVRGCRRALCVGYAERAETWAVWHVSSGRSIVFHCPSKAYALKLIENVLPYCDLFKLESGTWEYVNEAFPPWFDDYLRDIWRNEPKLEEIPGVEKWLRSKGLSKSGKPAQKMRVRKRQKS